MNKGKKEQEPSTSHRRWESEGRGRRKGNGKVDEASLDGLYAPDRGLDFRVATATIVNVETQRSRSKDGDAKSQARLLSFSRLHASSLSIEPKRLFRKFFYARWIPNRPELHMYNWTSNCYPSRRAAWSLCLSITVLIRIAG